MFKESIALEALLEIFVAGGLFIIGAWYLHRPFLGEYFPEIAAGIEIAGPSKLGGKVLIFFVVSMLSGVFITHMFDAVVPLIIGDRTYLNKRYSSVKRLVIILFRLVTFRAEPDPRVVSVSRYLNSSRKDWFLAMASDWAKTSEQMLDDDAEKIRLHQHVVARLRAHSENSREVLQDAYNQVTFAGSIFTSLLLLLPVSLAAFYTDGLVTKEKTLSFTQLLSFFTVIYFGAAISAFSLRRRLRNFFGSVLTVGLHFFDIERSANRQPKETKKWLPVRGSR